MGASQSNTGNSDECDILSLHYKELYSDLLSRCPMSFKDGLISLLGGQSAELGEKLYHYLFHESDRDPCCPTEVDCDKFVIAMTKLHTMISCGTKEFSRFFFSLFSNTESDMEAALYTAATCALHIGLTNELSIPNNQPIISSMITSMMQYSGKHKEESQETNFQQWLGIHSPHVLAGVIQWLYTILLPSSEKRVTYHLPVIECKEERLLQLNVTMWVLSGVLPTLFLGALPSSVKEREALSDDLPCGGIWTSLYSSKDQGFSMNRFQHHCFDYKQPSIMIINCHHQRENLLYSFAIAMDSEWRDGTYFYGGSNFHFIQLQPVYSLLKKGEKLVSINEKQRGFPTGLRIMASQKYDYCLFEVGSSLADARLREGEWMKVEFMEVWGCGGMQARETQLRIKEWESREVLRRRQINNKDMRTTWQDNPDRYLLEMGGVSTSAESNLTVTD